jgi:hypothetical protein
VLAAHAMNRRYADEPTGAIIDPPHHNKEKL